MQNAFYFLRKGYLYIHTQASLVAQWYLPMKEMLVQFLYQEEPLERKWQPTPVFLPGKSHGQRGLASEVFTTESCVKCE